MIKFRLKLINKIRLRATTLVEMLIMMIISGIVFISVMDGFGLFSRYASKVGERIAANSHFYDSYYHLESLITTADSILASDGVLSTFKLGQIRAILYERDSVLIAVIEEMRDTLFSNVVSLSATINRLDERVVESVKIVIRTETDSVLKLSFPVNVPILVKTEKDISESEKMYAYE